MGSPATEPYRESHEDLHRRLIPRRFEIAAKEVSVSQYQEFVRENPQFGVGQRFLDKYSPDLDGPMIGVNWFGSGRLQLAEQARRPARGSACPGRGGGGRSVPPRPRSWSSWPSYIIGSQMSFTRRGSPPRRSRRIEKALAILQRLADANPGVTEYQIELARSRFNIGLRLALTGQPNKSLASFEQARAILQKLADANPSDANFRLGLAKTYI